MRRILLAALFVVLLCGYAYADAMLYRGNSSMGSVPSVDNNSALCVPVEDVGMMFGFSIKHSGDELILTRGKTLLRISAGATAGWHGYAIIPLYSAPFEKDGKFWLDDHSTAALFQTVVGRGVANRLKFAKISGGSVASSRSDFGDFGDNMPLPSQARAQAQVQPQAKPKAQTQESSINLDAILREALRVRTQDEQQAQPVAASSSQTSKQAQPVVASSQTSEQAQPVAASSSQQEVQPSANKSSPSKAQPKLETFSPDDSRSEKGEYYSGTIQSIRWTSQEGSHKKIRAVVMTDDEADPQVFMDGGKLHALFSTSLENSKSVASPFSENVDAKISSSIDGVDLTFTPKGITKAEKLVLNNPRRIVFDFFYPEESVIIGTSPATTDTNIQLPGQVSPTQMAQVSPASSQSSTKKADPVITADPSPDPAKLPAVMTPPSTITIPTSPQAAQRLGRLNNGRKTIVIDPGHGGKDPGAMDNGVKEKDVNLAVGLELQRALTAKGYNVIMTRATDIYLKLQERTDIANDAKADLFVSVHVNALPSRKSMTGFEIYIMALPTDKDAMNLAKIENREYVEGKGMDTENVDRKTEMLLRILGDLQQNNKISESTDFAAMLYNAGVRNGLPMRRVAQAPFFVLRGAGMPAVLLEIGFVTNASESQLLTTPAYQQRIASAMSEGIANYIR